ERRGERRSSHHTTVLVPSSPNGATASPAKRRATPVSAPGQRAPATPVRIERAFLSRPNHAVPKSTRSACHVGVGLRCPAVRTRVLLISPLARAAGAERAFAALAREQIGRAHV